MNEEIDKAIECIEAEFIEYTNKSSTLKQAQEMQRFIINNLIKQLQDRLREAEKLTKQFVDHINDINNGDDPSECEKYLFNLVSEYQKKWREKV